MAANGPGLRRPGRTRLLDGPGRAGNKALGRLVAGPLFSWNWARMARRPPSPGAVLYLSLYQVILIALQGINLAAAPDETPIKTALLVHLILRGSALVLLWVGWWRIVAATAKGGNDYASLEIVDDEGEKAKSGENALANQAKVVVALREPTAARGSRFESAAGVSLALAVLAIIVSVGNAAFFMGAKAPNWWILGPDSAILLGSIVAFLLFQKQDIQSTSIPGETCAYASLAMILASFALVAASGTLTDRDASQPARRKITAEEQFLGSSEMPRGPLAAAQPRELRRAEFSSAGGKKKPHSRRMRQ